VDVTRRLERDRFVNELSSQALSGAWSRRAATSDPLAERELIRALTPIIRASVARTMRRFASRRREIDQEVEDVTQGVLLVLFVKDGGRALSRWDPDRGLALEGFVALLAAHETASILRNRRRSPWTEEPMATEALDENPTAAAGPEAAASSRRMIAAVVDRVRARVSARGGQVFDLLFLEGHPPEDISALTGLGLPAVYTWSSRLSRLGRQIAAELEGERAALAKA
jgi:RNA polymerase sigma-70 factor (ECF subfamily)